MYNEGIYILFALLMGNFEVMKRDYKGLKHDRNSMQLPPLSEGIVPVGTESGALVPYTHTKGGLAIPGYIGPPPQSGLTPGSETLQLPGGDDIVGTGGSKIPTEQRQITGNTEIDNILYDATEDTRKIGTARNFVKSGGLVKAYTDFYTLELSNIKDIQTQYGPGKIGYLDNGISVSIRPGSKTGGPTVEIRISGRNIIKIRY